MEEICVWELQFEKIKADDYFKLLEEVEKLLDENVNVTLIKKIATNGKEKIMLNSLIHANKLFGTDKDLYPVKIIKWK